MSTNATMTKAPTAAAAEKAPRVIEPAVDVHESENELTLFVDLPGVALDAVELSVDEGLLTLRATKSLAQPEGYELALSELRRGEYRRDFVLGEGVDTEKIEASLKAGVLRLTLPKARRAHVIEVHSA